MPEDPIVEEVRKIRREQLAKFNGDVHKLIDDLRRRQTENPEGVVSFPSTPFEPGKVSRRKSA
jgi:hypothetical protein